MSFDPIVGKGVYIPGKVKQPQPTMAANVQLVVVDRNGEVHFYAQPPTRGEATFGRVRSYCEVDVAEHDGSVEFQLPCQEKELYFDVKVSFAWAVHDPVRIVRDERHDVTGLCADHLGRIVKHHGERFGIEDRLDVEKALEKAISQDAEMEQGVTIRRAGVDVHLGPKAAEYIKRRTVHTIDLDFQAKDHELRAREQEQNSELKQLELTSWVDRVEIFEELLGRGDISLIAAHLANHPDDVGGVIDMAVKARNANIENSRKLMELLVDGGLVDAADMDGARQQALANLFDGLNPTGFFGQLGGNRPEGLSAGAGPAEIESRTGSDSGTAGAAKPRSWDEDDEPEPEV